ncbi:MAG: hypothetical protein HQL62_02615 [Magnetococcales bacterium]|nr:hypothetical protein [Magnetococcales bacterium]
MEGIDFVLETIGLGGRLASELAGMTNQAEIQALLLRETRRIRATAAGVLQKMIEEHPPA